MFKKSLVGSQLPVHSNQYYITVKFLKKLANVGKVKLHQLICSSGTIFALADKDENHIEKLYLGSTHPKNSTFIRNHRYDGKLEEVRLDKLMQVIF